MAWNSSMDSNTTSNDAVYILHFIKQKLLIHLPLIIIILGIIGFIGNIVTFLQPVLRYNTCCIYLLCSSLVDVTNLFVNLVKNYTNLTMGHILLSITASHSCKMKLFGLVFLPQLSINLLILSVIDRYACTCSLTSSIRYIRRLTIAPWMIIIITIISAVISFYSVVFYDVKPDFGCTCTDPFWNGIFYISIHGILTPFVMLVFVLLTYQNVCRSRHRAGSKNLTNLDRSRNPFIRMIFTQVFTTSFLTLQWICFYIYHVVVRHKLKSDQERTVHYFIWFICNNVYYLINVKSFYLSTLTSRLFRETFVKSLLQWLPKRQQ